MDSPGDSNGPGGSPQDQINNAPEPPTQPMLREDQISNAVAFLSHPKVRGSPEASKRAFLHQKGLTADEIEEAFRRAPATPVPSAEQPLAATGHGGAIATTASPVQPSQHALTQLPPRTPEPPPVRWSQVALGAGFAAASAYAVKSIAWPFVHSKISSWRGRPSVEVAAAEPLPPPTPASDVAALADAIRAQTAEMSASIQALKELVGGMDGGGPASAEDRVTAAELRQELQSITHSLSEIAAAPHAAAPAASPVAELAEIKAMLAEYLRTPPRPSSSSTGGASKDRGTLSTPQFDAHTSTSRPSGLLSRQESSSKAAAAAPAPAAAAADGSSSHSGGSREPAHHPSSYMEVLEMLERGETPPGIRDDINDKPPNPAQPPPPSRMAMPPKPWEGGRSTGAAAAATSSSTATPSAAPDAPQQQLHKQPGLAAHPLSAITTTVEPDYPQGSISLSPSALPAGTLDEELHEDGNGNGNNNNGGGDDADSGVPSSFMRGSSSPSPRHALAGAERRRAASIFEAATSPHHGSPGVIAGRMSPAEVRRRGAATPTSLVDRLPEVARSPYGSTAGGEGSGSGLGRPASRGWRPPPMPMPTLSGEASSHAAPENGSDGGGVASLSPSGGGKGASTASLGADFSSA